MNATPAPSRDRIEQHPAVIAARAAEMRFHREHPVHARAWFALAAADEAHRNAVLAGQTSSADLETAEHAYHAGTNSQTRIAFGCLLDANIDAWDGAEADLIEQDRRKRQG